MLITVGDFISAMVAFITLERRDNVGDIMEYDGYI